MACVFIKARDVTQPLHLRCRGEKCLSGAATAVFSPSLCAAAAPSVSPAAPHLSQHFLNIYILPTK